jgi:hypothetical protein
MASLPLLPHSSPRLVGIARLASHSDTVGRGHEVEYFALPAKSLLNRCTSTRMPFAWTINPYRGCEFACKYCYARYTHEFMEMRDGIEFEQKIYAKQHAADLLRQELRQVKPGEDIALGTATDPYQPLEKKLEITRSILEEFARHSGLEIGIVTKSTMVTRDTDLLAEIAKRNQLYVNLTIGFAPGGSEEIARRSNSCRRDLRSRSAGHHGCASPTGRRGPDGGSRGRLPCALQSAFS